MIIRALLPKLTPKTVKEKIIVILSSEFPLTIKELKQKIKQSFNKSVSYQSVHKELHQLMQDEIIINKDKKYLLNVEWIRQVGLFSDLIISNYTSERKHSINKLLELKKDGDSITFEFPNYVDLDQYFLDLLQYFNEFFEEEKPILMHYSHNWWPIVYPMKEKMVLENLKSKMYCICNSNSSIDKYCSNYENSIGMNVIYSTDPRVHRNVNVMGDLIFTFYSDPKVHIALDEFFNKHKDFKTLDLNELVRTLQTPGSFRVVVIKDSAFAKSVLEELKMFNK